MAASRATTEPYECYVYGLRSKDCADVFYVGSTKLPPAKRLKQHLDMIRLGWNRNRHLARKVAKVGPENIAVDVLEVVDSETRFVRECEWIRKLAGEGARLTNVVMDPDTYARTRAHDDYLDRVTSPEYLRQGYLWLLAGPQRTPDPRNQALADKFWEVAMLLFEHIRTKYPEEFAALGLAEISAGSPG